MMPLPLGYDDSLVSIQPNHPPVIFSSSSRIKFPIFSLSLALRLSWNSREQSFVFLNNLIQWSPQVSSQGFLHYQYYSYYCLQCTRVDLFPFRAGKSSVMVAGAFITMIVPTLMIVRWWSSEFELLVIITLRSFGCKTLLLNYSLQWWFLMTLASSSVASSSNV
jgi:hypothetical protein